MYGRFALNVTTAEVEKLCGYEERPNFPPRDNIAPTEPIAVVTFENDKRHYFKISRRRPSTRSAGL